MLHYACFVAFAALQLQVQAFGQIGHRVVGTIAQANLHPSAAAKIVALLPAWSGGQLAEVAAWADQVRDKYPLSPPLHYTGSDDDLPPKSCSYGENGWMKNVSILTAIPDYAALVEAENTPVADRDIALRFLVHFMGDLHHPLHLSGRARGGNSLSFRFEGKRSNLHSIWDGQIINKRIREMTNYTSPTTNKRLEAALRGKIYDPYIRWIVQEGISSWWASESTRWAACPESGDTRPSSFSRIGRKQRVFRLKQQTENELPEPDPYSTVCPYYWSADIHALNCGNIVIWPQESLPGHPLRDLSDDDYLLPIEDSKLIERLLAMAGIRLAGVLNSIFMD